MAKKKKQQQATYDLIKDAMRDGFEALSAQLAPLRQLTPPSVPELSQDVAHADGFAEGYDRGFRAGLDAASRSASKSDPN
jgi:hypothetical protein